MATSSFAFVPGDVLRFHRDDYSHLALYIGEASVIHRWSPTTDRAFQVRIDTIAFVLDCQAQSAVSGRVECCTDEIDATMLRVHQLVPLDGAEVVRRARSKLGEQGYGVLTSNCEHFVTWARYGTAVSPQATSHTGDVIAAALLGAAVAGMTGFLVGGAISLFTKANLFSTSVGASVGGAMEAMTVEAENEKEKEGKMAQDLAGADSEGCEEELVRRLAEDQLMCGICFDDLQRTRAVSFPCHHFTCAKCYYAFTANDGGHKNCPYCREEISSITTISRSTKRAARAMVTQLEVNDGEFFDCRSHAHTT